MATYENVGEPVLMEMNVFWFNESQTKNGWLRRGQMLADDGKTGIGSVIEFNGPEHPNGAIKGMVQIVDVTPDKGEPYTQYQLLGAGKVTRH